MDGMPTMTQIGERFRHARVEAGMTQQDVADRIGLSRSSIANFEAGRQDPPTSKLVALCDAVSVSVGALWSPPEPCPTCGCAWRGPRSASS